ncbi:MAG: TRAP transporter substrate-binding protein [Burkholderiaceae bacterium]|nr:TRAP transporter substrate-binding protein [Burkholderiaceae bacterium]
MKDGSTLRRSILAAGFVAGVVAFGAVRSAHAEVEIKFPIKVNASTERGIMTQRFGDELAKATNGRYKLTIYPGGQLYGGAKAAKAVALGNVQMTNEPNSGFTGFTKNANIIELPFGFRDEKHFQSYIRGSKSAAIRKDLDAAGFHVLALFDEGPFVIASRTKLIKEPADFKGQVIRTSGHPVVVSGLKGMGASTVKIALNEVYSAIQQGTITGVYTTFDAFINEKLYEVAPNVLMFPSYGAYFWVANKAWWNTLPEADRKLMDDLAVKLGKEYDELIWKKMDQFKAALAKGGGTLNDPTRSAGAVDRFQKAMSKTYDKLRAEFGKERVDEILN